LQGSQRSSQQDRHTNRQERIPESDGEADGVAEEETSAAFEVEHRPEVAAAAAVVAEVHRAAAWVVDAERVVSEGETGFSEDAHDLCEKEVPLNVHRENERVAVRIAGVEPHGSGSESAAVSVVPTVGFVVHPIE